MSINFSLFSQMKTELILWILLSFDFYSCKIDPLSFIVYGPGLDSSINFPVRYFFVQLNTENSVNYAEIYGKLIDNLIDVRFQLHQTGRYISINHNVLYLKNGLFVIRYRLLNSILHEHVSISLLWIPTSTYIGIRSFLLKAPIYSEKCNCPQFPLKFWLSEKLNCSENYQQINEDFSEFHEIDPDQSFNTFFKIYNPFTSVAVCRYKIISNNIYRKCFGEHVGFHVFSDSILLSLSRKVKLPDLDLLFNLGDWPLSLKNKDKFTVLSWCGSSDSYDIVIPSYETTEWVLEMMGRVYLDIFTVLSESSIPWKKKKSKAFWRGRDSSYSRLNLVRMSLKHPDILDAKLTNMFFFPNDSTLGQLKKPISFIDFFQYKYVINMDGTVAAYRYPLSLAGGSLLFKEESKYYEFIYSQLLSGKHYLSIKSDLSDLLEKLNWSKSNDAHSEEIAKEARNFTLSNLMPQNIFCYFGRVLDKYHSLMNKSVTVSIPEDFELISDKFQELNCVCSQTFNNQDSFHDEL